MFCLQLMLTDTNLSLTLSVLSRSLYAVRGKNILRARTVLSPRYLYYSSLMEKKYLAKWMWLCEDKLRVKIAHFRLPSASQKRACLKCLYGQNVFLGFHYLCNI